MASIGDTVVMSCGDCQVPSGSALRCRIARAHDLPATWDQERQQLCCVVPKVGNH